MLTENEFNALAAEGHNRIPLVAQALADLDTPLSLYLKLTQGNPLSFLLESVVGGERFGRYAPADLGRDGAGHWVWVHAVSLGETRAAALLIAELRMALPGMRLLLTKGTATGRAEGRKLLQPGDVQVWHLYLLSLVLAVAFVGLFKYKHERVAPGAQPVVH